MHSDFEYLFNECGHGGCGWSDTKVIVSGNIAADSAGYLTIPNSLHLEIRIQNSYDMIVIEGGPGGYTVTEGLHLVAKPGDPHAAPKFEFEVGVPRGMSMQELATNLVDAAKAYQNNLPYNYPVVGIGKLMWGYNSNSYVSGILMQATGKYQAGIVNAARKAGYLVPGFEKPMSPGAR